MDAGLLRAYLLSRGYPIAEVTLPSSDRATWRLTCDVATTQATIDEAVGVLRTQPLADIQTFAADHDATNTVSQKAIQATVLWTLRRLLGRPPTGPEISTARTEWMTIFKTL